jgi:hypothetical protein
MTLTRFFLLLLVIAAHALWAEAPVSYSRDVRPILAERCQACHLAPNTSAKLSVAAVKDLLEGGVSGPAVKPGQPDQSLLIQFITGAKPRMPKAGAPLTKEQIATIRQWIAEGARDDAGATSTPGIWWSLRPLYAPSVPVDSSPWIRTPVDAFIMAKLQAAQLTPAPAADRRVLVRRLYFDLHGLPPTPAESDAFLQDRSADAYEKLVDRLLASPRYGERWTRHWLDVVHYGDSHGYDKDKPRPNAWPYRDWVIRAFNEDKPYTRFIQEQLAGDVLFPEDPQALIATGFIAAGPWDFVGHQELREGTVDKDQTRVLDRDDMVATTVSAFLSMTAHCARCHDHKFDPITQEDYYSLQAVFAGVDRADQPFDDDPAVYAKRRDLLWKKQILQRRLQPLLDRVEFAKNPEIEELDSRIQDAGLLIVHMGKPKTDAEAAEKARLEERRAADQKRRKELVDAIVGEQTYKAIDELKEQIKPIDAALESLPKPRYVYSAASFFPRVYAFRPSLEPRPVHVLARGNVRSPLKAANAGALSCVVGLSSRFDVNEEGARRASLANWIADHDNVLTWRSIVNRVWHYHFGVGLSDSPSDFGRMGSEPTHPELLDWLAVWFRDEAGGSLKKLHKLIVTSAVYRQSSLARPTAAKIDADNRLLWRMNRMRLDAESIRDSALLIAGKLDMTMGGPAVRMFGFKDDHSPVYDYTKFDPDAEGAHRRSIYRFTVRSVPDPFMERLDCPDPSVLTPKRSTTLTAIQALAMWNNPFMVRMSEHFAARVREASADPAKQVDAALQLIYGRSADPEELKTYQEYAVRHGLENLCRVLFNSNEFLFVD